MGEPAFDWTEVRRAFFAGEYTACRALLETAPHPEADLWLARMDNRQGRSADTLRRLLPLSCPTPRLAAERDVWLANAYIDSEQFDLAHRLLDRALPVLQPYQEPYHRGLYVRALVYYISKDYAADERVLEELLKSPDPKDRAQAYGHASWIAAKRDEDLRRQARYLSLALAEHLKGEERDQYALAHTLVTLSALCRELPIVEPVERIKAAFAQVHRSEATAFPLFQLGRILGWIDALQGKELSALRYWRDAERFAPTEFWRVFCLVDRAYFFCVMGRQRAAAESLAAADELASRLPWSSTRDEERMILLTIAQLYAEQEPARAQRYLAMFRSLTTEMDARIGWVGDRRTRAFQLAAQGIALLHLGEKDDAVTLLEESWSIFGAFEYGWRAALSALHLYLATDRRDWLERAREQIAPWPQSWIARDVAEATKRATDRT